MTYCHRLANRVQLLYEHATSYCIMYRIILLAHNTDNRVIRALNTAPQVITIMRIIWRQREMSHAVRMLDRPCTARWDVENVVVQTIYVCMPAVHNGVNYVRGVWKKEKRPPEESSGLTRHTNGPPPQTSVVQYVYVLHLNRTVAIMRPWVLRILLFRLLYYYIVAIIRPAQTHQNRDI